MPDFVRSHFYFIVLLLTAGYTFFFATYIASRYHSSLTARRYLVYLLGVLLWALKDAIAEILQPSFGADTVAFSRFLAAIAPFYLVVPLFTFSMLVAVHDAARPGRAFPFSRHLLAGMGVVLAAIWVASLFDPSVLYRSIELRGASYVYEAGPGLMVFTFTICSRRRCRWPQSTGRRGASGALKRPTSEQVRH